MLKINQFQIAALDLLENKASIMLDEPTLKRHIAAKLNRTVSMREFHLRMAVLKWKKQIGMTRRDPPSPVYYSITVKGSTYLQGFSTGRTLSQRLMKPLEGVANFKSVLERKGTALGD